MGFVKPTLPDVDLEEFLGLPLRDRLRIMSLKWWIKVSVRPA